MQSRHVVHVVQERGEPHLSIPSCCLPYPLQRTGRVNPAQCPGRVLLARVSFGQIPSLHCLRSRVSGLVRRLPRSYGPVRLPEVVHRRRMPRGFPTRSAGPSPADNPRTSRFPRMVYPGVPGVSDRAGSRDVSRWRRLWCGLPLLPTASAPWSSALSRLNTRPARTPIDASMTPLREPPHDSEPVWVASPSPYDSFIHTTMPVLTGAPEDARRNRCGRFPAAPGARHGRRHPPRGMPSATPRRAPPATSLGLVYTAACTRTNRLEHEAQSPA